MLKVCLQCGEEFDTGQYKAKKYCSKICQSSAQIKAKTYTCTGCGIAFQRPNYVIKKDAIHRFCNPACQTEWRKKNAYVAICKVCGKEFKPGNTKINHCSKKCRDKGLITQVEMTCEYCHKTFKAFATEAAIGRKFCSDPCSRAFHTGAHHHAYRGGKWLRHGEKWKKIRRKILERDKCCRWCGAVSNPSGRELSVHHINGRRNYLIVDMANEERNLVTLCASCHMKVEQAITHGRISSLPKWLRPPVSK